MKILLVTVKVHMAEKCIIGERGRCLYGFFFCAVRAVRFQ